MHPAKHTKNPNECFNCKTIARVEVGQVGIQPDKPCLNLYCLRTNGKPTVVGSSGKKVKKAGLMSIKIEPVAGLKKDVVVTTLSGAF